MRGTAAKRSRLKDTVSAIEGRLSKLKNKEVTPEQAPAGRIEKFFRYKTINHIIINYNQYILYALRYLLHSK